MFPHFPRARSTCIVTSKIKRTAFLPPGLFPEPVERANCPKDNVHVNERLGKKLERCFRMNETANRATQHHRLRHLRLSGAGGGINYPPTSFLDDFHEGSEIMVFPLSWSALVRPDRSWIMELSLRNNYIIPASFARAKFRELAALRHPFPGKILEST